MAFAAVLASCGGKTEPQPSVFSKVLDKGYATYYGNYYQAEGIDCNILSLDLYSPTITFDSVGRIGGTGTNVYLSDIFIQPDHKYLSRKEFCCDTTYQPFTFLAGMEYENHYSGAYLLNIKENGYSVTLVKDGTMTVSYNGDSTIIGFELLLDNPQKTIYKGQYRGILPYYDATAESSAASLPAACKTKRKAVSR